MDSITYKSLTGLQSYEGLKILLKNSAFGSRFNISDSTISLNSIKCITLNGGPNVIRLEKNQFGVVLCFVSGHVSPFGSTVNEGFISKDLNGDGIIMFPNNAVYGQVFIEQVNRVYDGVATLTFAVFDCF